MNWKFKAAVQWGFAHLPYGEHLNHLAQIARGSFSPDVQLRELLIQLRYLRRLNDRFPLAGKVAVEIGPGWQGLGILSLHLFGCARIIAIDQEPHIRWSLLSRLMEVCRSNWNEICDVTGMRFKPLGKFTSLNHALSSMSVQYLAPGNAAATGLSRASVDLVYSYGVLEHISPKALEAICEETARILKPTGRACHNIGLHDHFHDAGIGNGVNFLRYSERQWNALCGNRITYHNRLRLPQYLGIFSAHGLTPLWSERELLDSNLAALRSLRVNERFAGMSSEDLATSHLYIDLAPH